MSDISRRATTPDLSSLLGPDFDALFNSVKRTMPGATSAQTSAGSAEPLPPIAAPITTAEETPEIETFSQPEPTIEEPAVQEMTAPVETARPAPSEERTVMDLMPDLSALVNDGDSYSKPTVSDVINLQTMATAQNNGNGMDLNTLFENTGVEDLPPEEEVDMPLVPTEASSGTPEDNTPVDLSTLEDEPEVILNAASPIVQAAVISTIEQDNTAEEAAAVPLIDENNLLAEEPSGTGYDPFSELAEAAAAESELPAFADQPAEITPPPAVAGIADEADSAADSDQQAVAEAITAIPAAAAEAAPEISTADNSQPAAPKGKAPRLSFITKPDNVVYGLLAATALLAITTLIFGLLFINASSAKAELKGQLQVLTSPKAFTGCQRLSADDNHANCIFRANYQLTRCVEVCSVSKYRQVCEESCHDSAKSCEKSCPAEDKQEMPQVLVIKTTAEPQTAPADAATDHQEAAAQEAIEAYPKTDMPETVSTEPEKPKAKTKAPAKKSPAKKNTKKPTAKKRK